jgi:potassium efflux system protein
MRDSLPFILAAVLVMAILSVSAPSQEKAPPTDALTVAALESRLKEVEADEKLGKELKEKLVEQYKLAIAKLEDEARFLARAKELKQRLETDPAETKGFREWLADPSRSKQEEPEVSDFASKTSKELEKTLTELEPALAEKRKTLDDLKAKLKELEDRPKAARTQLEEAKKKLEEIDRELKKPAPSEEPEAVGEARKIVLTARRRARSAEIEALNQEILGHAARVERLSAERDKTEAELKPLALRVKVTKKARDQRQVEEATRDRERAEQARREAAGKHEAITAVADQTAEWSNKLETVAKTSQAVTARRSEIEKDTKRITEEFERTSQRLDKVGLSDLIARLLRRQRLELPDAREFQKKADDRVEETQRLELASIDAAERLAELADLDAATREAMAPYVDKLTPEKRVEVEAEVRKQLAAQKELLSKLQADQAPLLRELGNLDFEERKLIDKAQEYARFLDERLLWIRSAPPLGLQTPQAVLKGLAWLGTPARWGETAQTLGRALESRPVLAGLALVLLIGLFAVRRLLRKRRDWIRSRVGKVRTDGFGLTLQAMAIDLVAVLPAPLVLGFLAWQLRVTPSESVFPRSIGGALAAAALVIPALHFLHRLVSKGDVAEVHFRWSGSSLAAARRRSMWILLWAVVLPATFLVAVTESPVAFNEARANEVFQNGLGRLGYLALMAALAVVVAQLLHPRKGLPANRLETAPTGWIAQLRYIWYPLAVAIPIALAVLSGLGFYYTAIVLGGNRLVMTLLLVIGGVIVQSMLQRWLYVVHRRMAWEKALEERKARREAEAAAPAAGETESPRAEDGSALEAPEEPEVDLKALNKQTGHLVRMLVGATVLIGLWMIWASVLPALNVLDEVKLWSYSRTTPGVGDQLVWITMSSILLAVVVAVITFVASRNIPAALELTLLQRLPIDAGSRYAIATLSQYVIVLIGLIVAFNLIGLGWSQVQWLVAAVGVGLGFGLQEIFANFVSGLILLFERPIRVGDIVTIGDVSGMVTRIRIRATTVRDWDRKELIVPNKEFITGRLLNWTLTDPMNRVTINVGVAYGSDTQRARELLLKVANDHPLILDDPAPLATFEGFGDSTLNLVLRCFLPDLANRLATIHELHTAVDQAFREAGIEIAFPQRDLHLRSVDTSVSISDAGRCPGSDKDEAEGSSSEGR